MGERTTDLSQAALNDESGGDIVTELADTLGIYTVAIPIQLATVPAGDVLTGYVPGHRFEIVDFDFAVSVAVTTGAKAATLNLEIGTNNLTGGAIALTSANCTPLGAIVAGSAITGNNVGSATDAISIEGSSVTAFAEGAGYALIKIKNLDTADALASLAAALSDAGITRPYVA